MEFEKSKLPKPNAVKELRERYYKRKEERSKKYKELVEIFKKQMPTKKTAKTNGQKDVEL